MKRPLGQDRSESAGGLGAGPASASSLLAVAQTVRVGEALLMMGFPLAGAVFGIRDLSFGSLATAFWSLLAMVPIAISVYASNALGGLSTDRVDPKFRGDPRFGGTVNPASLEMVGWVGLGLGAALGFLVSPGFAMALVALWALWYLYSRPGGFKAVPGAGAAVHLLGGVLMFLAPYAVQRPLDDRGVLMSVAFALAFAAGHAHHEIMDRWTDAAAQVRTGAVVWGPKRAVWLGLVLAAACYLSIGLAWWVGALNLLQIAPFAVAFPLHLGFGLTVLKSEDIDGANQRYRHRYRVVFGVAVVLSLVATIVELALS